MQASAAAARRLEDPAEPLARAVALFRLSGEPAWPGKDEADAPAGTA